MLDASLQSKLAAQSGFSLIELLVAAALFIVVTAAIYGLLESARSDRFVTNQRVEIMQQARNALNAIGRDALNAGYGFPQNGVLLPDNALGSILGLPIDPDQNPDILMPIVAGNQLNPNDLSGTNTDQITFVFRDVSFNQEQPVNILSIVPSGAQVTIDTRGPDGIAGTADDINNGIFNINDLFIITGRSTAANASSTTISVLGMVTSTAGNDKVIFASSDPLGVNRPSASFGNLAAVTTPATMTKIVWVTYRVLRDGTLVRTVYGGVATGSQDMPLAYGVERFRIEYVLADGSISANPAAGPDGVLGTSDDAPLNMANVRQVRINLTVRSSENDRRNGQPFRVTLSSTFNTRNLGYDTR